LKHPANRAGHVLQGNKQIIFADRIEAQAEMRLALLRAGVSDEHIAVINADTAPRADKRIEIAEDFNLGKYRVVIGGALISEGVNLQIGTVAMHFMELPWNAQVLTQRKGRGHRQGNAEREIEIFYYLLKGSMDPYRWGTIQTKANWWRSMREASGSSVRTSIEHNPVSLELIASIAKNPAEAVAEMKESLAKAQIEVALRDYNSVKTELFRALLDTKEAIVNDYDKRLQQSFVHAAQAMRSSAEEGRADALRLEQHILALAMMIRTTAFLRGFLHADAWSVLRVVLFSDHMPTGLVVKDSQDLDRQVSAVLAVRRSAGLTPIVVPSEEVGEASAYAFSGGDLSPYQLSTSGMVSLDAKWGLSTGTSKHNIPKDYMLGMPLLTVDSALRMIAREKVVSRRIRRLLPLFDDDRIRDARKAMPLVTTNGVVFRPSKYHYLTFYGKGFKPGIIHGVQDQLIVNPEAAEAWDLGVRIRRAEKQARAEAPAGDGWLLGPWRIFRASYWYKTPEDAPSLEQLLDVGFSVIRDPDQRATMKSTDSKVRFSGISNAVKKALLTHFHGQKQGSLPYSTELWYGKLADHFAKGLALDGALMQSDFDRD
jgi:hypothetical protein